MANARKIYQLASLLAASGKQFVPASSPEGQLAASLEGSAQSGIQAEVEKEQAKKAKQAQSGLGGIVGSVGGAAVGTLVAPGAGTMIGAQIGGGVGAGAENLSKGNTVQGIGNLAQAGAGAYGALGPSTGPAKLSGADAAKAENIPGTQAYNENAGATAQPPPMTTGQGLAGAANMIGGQMAKQPINTNTLPSVPGSHVIGMTPEQTHATLGAVQQNNATGVMAQLEERKQAKAALAQEQHNATQIRVEQMKMKNAQDKAELEERKQANKPYNLGMEQTAINQRGDTLATGVGVKPKLDVMAEQLKRAQALTAQSEATTAKTKALTQPEVNRANAAAAASGASAARQKAEIPEIQQRIIHSKKDVERIQKQIDKPTTVNPSIAHEWNAIADKKTKAAANESDPTKVQQLLDDAAEATANAKAAMNPNKATPQAPQIIKGPAIGEVQDGHVFLGGDPGDPSLWQKQ